MYMSGRGGISRRILLRGAGAAVAIPWLDAMAFGACAGKPPVRLAFFYVPNGVVMDNWRVKAPGKLADLPPILKSLDPVKEKILVLSDLAADHCIGNKAGHEPAGGGFLVGAKCKHSEEPEVAGPSIDQVAAQRIGLKTAVDSLALGIDPGMRGDHGYSGTYLSNISWRSKAIPAALEINPRQLYDRLFRGRAPKRPDWEAAEPELKPAAKEDTVEGSVLDAVREDARDLQNKLGFSDRRRLEEYFEGLRSIERRIEAAGKEGASHHREAFKDAPADGDLPKVIIPDGRGIPSTFAEHVTLMLDILTLAFQSDTTRVASFMFSYEKSGRAYPEVQASGTHHSTSHHQKRPEYLAKLTNINTLHMDLFARMLVRMSKVREGEGTLLDNVSILYGSGISDGNKHNHDDLPILVAGGPGGGRHLKLGKKTPLCNLYLDMMARSGVALEKFGDSTGPLGVLG